jgi:hypothetical protein
MSNSTGGFATPVTIGSINSSLGGNVLIPVLIPLNTVSGLGYKLRVVSSSPIVTGVAYSANFSVSANTITLTSAPLTNAQTRCINTAITNITYATTGATGATVSGLPIGVTGTWASNVFNISGTPTVAGTFNYTVTITGGCPGGTNTATGSITVTPNNTISLTSAAGTSAQTPCINTAITNITYATTGATGATIVSYCNASNAGGVNLSSVSMATTTLNATGLNAPAPNYSNLNPASGSTTATLNAGSTYSLSVATAASAIVSVWIDYDGNGDLAPSEWSQVYTSGTSGSVSITVPANALSGNTRMRVRSRAAGNTNGSGNACTYFGSGTTQEFTITIIGTGATVAGLPIGVTGTFQLYGNDDRGMYRRNQYGFWYHHGDS